MRLPPHTLCLMALRGRKTLHGWGLPSKEEARQFLRKLTEQDFGDHAEQWADWIKHNRKGLYEPRTPKGGLADE